MDKFRSNLIFSHYILIAGAPLVRPVFQAPDKVIPNSSNFVVFLGLILAVWP